MHRFERVTLWIVVLVALLLALGRPEFRGGSAVALAPADDPALGPASSLLLSGTKGTIELRNSDGRIGWTQDKFGRTWTLGFVHITQPLRRLREQARFNEEIEALVAEFQREDEAFQKRLAEVTERLRGLEQGSPEFQERYADGERIYQEYLQWQRTAMERRGSVEAKLMETAYRELIDAIEVVAERLGVDIVYRFIPTSDPFEATDLPGAFNEIRFRSVLRYPDGLDITPEVLKELGLEAD